MTIHPQNQSRSLYWDIVKGLGITAIVLGHTGVFAGAFVYLFHLALFFFITGYFYNEKKYGDEPFLYFGARLAGAWPKYMLYTSVFVLFHNFFVSGGLYAGQPLYNHTMMLTAICSGISFSCPEQIQGALWFVPVWLVSSSLFGGCVWFGRMVSERFQKPRLKLWLIALSSVTAGAAGLFLNMRKCGLPYNLQAALLVIPIYLAAWLLKQYAPSFRRFTTWYGCLISAFLLNQINQRFHIFIDLASMNVPGILFFPISVLGIYFVLSLADCMERVTALTRLFTFLGRQSFDIMAVHFLIFKLMDYGYARFILHSAPENLSSFPVSFRAELGFLYVIFGLLIPALIGWCIDRAIHFWYTGFKKA